MPPSVDGWPWPSVTESLVYEGCCKDLCQILNIDRQRLDDITSGLTWALGANPLQFPQVVGTVHAASVRGGGKHPDLLVIFTYSPTSGQTELHWIGQV